jgi:cytochrome c biogenesis protein CcmG/thiol:disulfide interchange protein DsbE
MMAAQPQDDSNWGDDHEQQSIGRRSGSPVRLLALFATLAVVSLIVVLVKLNTPQRDPTKEPAVGKRPERFEVTPLEGDGESLTLANLQGKVVLINFWGPWCPPCRAEFPELMELREGLVKEPRFQFVSVTAMPGEDEGDLVTMTKTYLQSQKYDLPIYRDTQFTAREEIRRLNQNDDFAFPTTVLLDPQGVIRAVWIGYKPGVGEEMRGQIENLLRATK